MRLVSVLYTADQQCYSVRYSPSESGVLACVSCDKLGVSGTACLFIAKYEENFFVDSKFSIVESYRSKNALFDVDWSPTDPSLLLTGNGDGSISLWKWPAINFERKALATQKEHSKEVYCVQWEPSGMRAYHFLSASCDHSIKIWNLNSSGLTALTNLNGHDNTIFSACWNPKTAGLLLSTSADKTFRVWDVNSSSLNSKSVFVSAPNKSDILCCDWNKFDPNVFVLGYASGLIETRDMRNLKTVVKSYEAAHDYAVKKIKFSPHFSNLFASVSYDMMTKLWLPDGCYAESKNHNEFAYALDFDPKISNRLVDAGWDRRVAISEFDLSNKFS